MLSPSDQTVFMQGREQLLEFHRLGQVARALLSERGDDRLTIIERTGHQHYRTSTREDPSDLLHRPDRHQGGMAIHIGHDDIESDEIEGLAQQECFLDRIDGAAP